MNRHFLLVVASRGRGKKSETDQRFEYRKDKACNTITSVQKDNYYVAKVCRNQTGN